MDFNNAVSQLGSVCLGQDCCHSQFEPPHKHGVGVRMGLGGVCVCVCADSHFHHPSYLTQLSLSHTHTHTQSGHTLNIENKDFYC